MHSFIGPSGMTYAHNVDFSGEVVMLDDDRMGTIGIPFEDIRAIYLESRRQREIAKLESAEYHELEKRFKA